MSSGKRFLFVLILLALTAGGAYLYFAAVSVPSATPPALAPPSKIVSRACDPLLQSSVPVECGFFRPGGTHGRFALPYVIFRAAPREALSPLVYIGGGPGAGMQTADERVQAWAYWIEESGLERDFVLYDQRGLKPGKPYWTCDAFDQISRRLLGMNISAEDEAQRVQPVLEQCLKEFDQWLRSPVVGVDGGLRDLTTSHAAGDLNQMLAALGYQQWDLWGVSYGSRVALVAAQQAPERVRSLLLDSPYPLDRGRYADKPELYANALIAFWKICRENQDLCGVEVSDPEALYWRVMDQLAQNPPRLRVRGPELGSSTSVVLTPHRFFALTLFALYDQRLYSELLKSLLELEARNSNSSASVDSLTLLLNALISSAFDPSFNTMVFFAMECNDNALGSAEAYEEAAMQHPRLYPFIVGDGRFNPCALNLFDPVDQLPAEPVVTAPTLILVGELDPVTPVPWAKGLAQQLPKAELLVVPQVAHAVVSSGACRPTLFNAFLTAPGARSVAGECR